MSYALGVSLVIFSGMVWFKIGVFLTPPRRGVDVANDDSDSVKLYVQFILSFTNVFLIVEITSLVVLALLPLASQMDIFDIHWSNSLVFLGGVYWTLSLLVSRFNISLTEFVESALLI